ncbi:hypothetical protein LTR17_018686 [Elasticomyces elasticus]|nr:hypothetical protein LTR17_018686 [Elasticomyces elasticus]
MKLQTLGWALVAAECCAAGAILHTASETTTASATSPTAFGSGPAKRQDSAAGPTVTLNLQPASAYSASDTGSIVSPKGLQLVCSPPGAAPNATADASDTPADVTCELSDELLVLVSDAVQKSCSDGNDDCVGQIAQVLSDAHPELGGRFVLGAIALGGAGAGLVEVAGTAIGLTAIAAMIKNLFDTNKAVPQKFNVPADNVAQMAEWEPDAVEVAIVSGTEPTATPTGTAAAPTFASVLDAQTLTASTSVVTTGSVSATNAIYTLPTDVATELASIVNNGSCLADSTTRKRATNDALGSCVLSALALNAFFGSSKLYSPLWSIRLNDTIPIPKDLLWAERYGNISAVARKSSPSGVSDQQANDIAAILVYEAWQIENITVAVGTAVSVDALQKLSIPGGAKTDVKLGLPVKRWIVLDDDARKDQKAVLSVSVAIMAIVTNTEAAKAMYTAPGDPFDGFGFFRVPMTDLEAEAARKISGVDAVAGDPCPSNDCGNSLALTSEKIDIPNPRTPGVPAVLQYKNFVSQEEGDGQEPPTIFPNKYVYDDTEGDGVIIYHLDNGADFRHQELQDVASRYPTVEFLPVDNTIPLGVDWWARFQVSEDMR